MMIYNLLPYSKNYQKYKLTLNLNVYVTITFTSFHYC